MEFVDDRTEEQKKSHTMIVLATDRFMSGWGPAKNGASYAGWACKPEDWQKVFDWVSSRSEMLRVRLVANNYRANPQYCAHCHIYVVGENHPSLH